MATAVLKTFGALQEELEKAKENLKGVDDHIKRIIGRDPNEGALRPGQKRPTQTEEFRGKGKGFNPNRGRRDPGENRPEPPELFTPGGRRRSGDPKNVFSRLSGPPRNIKEHDSGDDDDTHKPAVSSHVIATPREMPSRQEVMAVQGDERSKARNRRMFGALIGTLQKFRQEETRMKDREDKRAQVERKLEEAARKEKEELKKERQELFSERRRKQQEVRRIEIKMMRIKEQEEWETRHRPLMNFIQTKAKPCLFYLPKHHNAKSEERLVGSQKVVAEMMEMKREQVQEDLKRLDARAAARAQRGHFEEEEEENGVAEKQKGVGQGFDKENRLLLDVSLHDGAKAEEEDEEDGGSKFVRSRKERQRRERVEDGEEELEYDEHAKEDDDEDDEDVDMDASRDAWVESHGEPQGRRSSGNGEEDDGDPSPKRARRGNSDDIQDSLTQLDSSSENFERRHDYDSRET